MLRRSCTVIAAQKLYGICMEALRNPRRFSQNSSDFVKFLVTCTVFREWNEHASLHALHKMLSHPHLYILEWPIPTINQWCQDCRCNNSIVLSSHLLHYLAHITAKNCFRYTQEMSKSSLGSAINVLLKTIIKIYSVLGTTHSGSRALCSKVAWAHGWLPTRCLSVLIFYGRKLLPY